MKLMTTITMTTTTTTKIALTRTRTTTTTTTMVMMDMLMMESKMKRKRVMPIMSVMTLMLTIVYWKNLGKAVLMMQMPMLKWRRKTMQKELLQPSLLKCGMKQ